LVVNAGLAIDVVLFVEVVLAKVVSAVDAAFRFLAFLAAGN
jgi:hypothetical protein